MPCTPMTPEALAVAQQVVRQEVSRLRKFVKCAATLDDMAQEALLGACLSWRHFDPSMGVPWGAYLRSQVRTFARREENKSKSVVTTNYDKRKLDADDGMVVRGADGEWMERDFEDGDAPADERVASQQSLAAVYAECQHALRALPETQAAIAAEWLASGGETKAGELAEQFGVSTNTVHKALRAMKEAAAAAV